MEKGPQMPTPAEMAEFEKKRILSDAELIKGGADIEVDEKGNRTNLLATEAQKEKIGKEGFMTEKEEAEKRINKILEKENFKMGDSILIEVADERFKRDDKMFNEIGATFVDARFNKIRVTVLGGNEYVVNYEDILKLERRKN
jgi:hypothetical protein